MLEAVQQIRRMRGGSQAHLMRASDGNFYVTKFKNNPQHIRVLANEYIATRLGVALGLPMPETAVIQVSDWLVQNSPELRIETCNQTPCSSGQQLACRYAADPATASIFDYLPETMMARNTKNISDFARVLVFDKWTCNVDGRQAIFVKPANARKYSAVFIDQGYCFNASEWNELPESALRGVYARNAVYQDVKSWDDFEPVLTRAEQMDLAQLWKLTEGMPQEWCGDNPCELPRLIEAIFQRRLIIRDLITTFRNSSRQPFPNWTN